MDAVADCHRTLANQVAGEIIRKSLRIHSKLGPGLLETTYRICLAHELIQSCLQVQSELLLPVVYDGIQINAGYRIDLLVADIVIVEVKAVEQILPVHLAQLLTYLRLANKRVGLLINFNVTYLRTGLKRVVNQF